MKTLILLFAIPTFAAVCTTQAGSDGIASTAANWTGCGGNAPGNGDQVVLNKPITFNDTRTVGTSPSAVAVTANNAADTITCTVACNFANGDQIELDRNSDLTGSFISGLSPNHPYYVIGMSGNTFQVSNTSGGSAVLFTTDGSGVNARPYQVAIQINTASGGRLIVADTGVLTVRGDIRVQNPGGSTTIDAISQAGQIWNDSSQATNPSLTSYCLFGPSSAFTVGVVWRITGSVGARAEVGSINTNGAAAGGKCATGSDSGYAGDLVAQHVKFTRFGSAAKYAWNNRAIGSMSLQDYECDNCGTFQNAGLANSAATAVLQWVRGKFINTASGTPNVTISSTNAISGSGKRLFQDSYFDSIVGHDSQLPQVRDLTLKNVVFGGRSPAHGCGTASAIWAEVKNVLIFSPNKDAGAFVNLCGPADTVAFISTAGGNIRGLAATYNTYSPAIYNNIICSIPLEFNTSDGDCFGSSGGSPSSLALQALTLSNYLVLPGLGSGVRFNSGTFGTGGLANISQINLENVTAMGGQGPVLGSQSSGGSGNYSVVLAEASPGQAGRLQSMKGYLQWDIVRAIPSKHLAAGNTSTALNTATPDRLDYNACFNCSVSTRWGQFDADGAPPWTLDGSGTALTNYNTYYDVPMSGTVPGQHDVNGVDPKFVDDSRNFETWAAKFHGAAGNVAGTMAIFRDTPAEQLEARILHAVNWIKQGFAPQDLRYKVPAAPRGRIGSVDVVSHAGTAFAQ